MEPATKRRGHVTEQELRRAEEGLMRLLHAKRFPREWVERHAPEAMAQARVDFAARLAAGREDETVNLLVVIGYRRALKILDAQRSRPATTSLESATEIADDSRPTPEEEAIDHDRQERVVKAMGYLPERERKLLSLVYFEGLSIREAGRRLGWGKSAVDRHHQAALERLHAMLERSLLAPEIAIPAFVASRRHSLPRWALQWVQGAVETVRDATFLGGARVGPLAETGNAAALGGGGRAAAGLCGAAVVVCLAGAVSGIDGPGIGLGAAPQPRRHEAAREADRPLEPRAAAPAVQIPTAPSPGTEGRRAEARRPQHSEPPGTTPTRTRPSTQSATRTATPKQTVDEFGVESGEAEESSSAPAGEEATQARPLTAPSSAARPGAASPERSSSGAQSGSEFGL